MKQLASAILELSELVRYVAIYQDGKLTAESRAGLSDASSSESDKYEELFVNPAVLLLATQRGNVDCGGCQFVLIRYGNFFQLIRRFQSGHVSICISPEADPLSLAKQIFGLLDSRTTMTRT